MVRIVLGALALLASAPVVAQQALVERNETLLQVQAEGQSTVRPDAAFLSVGVVSTGGSAREATDANARAMAEVIAAIRKAGVGERYVRTQQINVQPRFERAAGGYEEAPRIAGYVARNSVAVTVVKLADAPDVIAAAFGAGANSVDGPNLGNEDPAAGMAAARDDALRNARAEAEAYAAGLGLRVSRVLRVSEQRGGIEPVRYITVTGSRSSAGAPPPPPPPPPPPIAGGELKRTMTIYIDYALVAK